MNYLTAIVIVAIVIGGIVEIVKAGTKYCENIERIKRGYPTIDGSRNKKVEAKSEGLNYTILEDNNGN